MNDDNMYSIEEELEAVLDIKEAVGYPKGGDFGHVFVLRQPHITIVGDPHLAPRQYGLARRRGDFFNTFHNVLRGSQPPSQMAIFLGDFFDSRKIDAEVFTEALEALKYYPIHYIFVEGNHDRALMKDEQTWIEALSAAINKWCATSRYGPPNTPMMLDNTSITVGRKYIAVLSGDHPSVGAAKLRIQKANTTIIMLCILDYAGANTKKALAEMVEQIKRMKKESSIYSSDNVNAHFILCGHFGVAEYAGGNIAGTISKDDEVFKEARELFRAMFLGHIHKQYYIERETTPFKCTVYGVGSMETMGFDEIEDYTTTFTITWSDDGDFSIDPNNFERSRPFIDNTIRVEGATSPTEYYERMISELAVKRKEIDDVKNSLGWGMFDDNDDKVISWEDAIVRLTLEGVVKFDRLKLNVPKIRDRLMKLTGAFHIMIRNRLSREGEIPEFLSFDTTRSEMEQKSVLSLADHSLTVHEDNLTALMSEIKDEVDKGASSNQLLNIIMESRLMEDIINENNKGDVDEH